jgi:hemolysin III
MNDFQLEAVSQYPSSLASSTSRCSVSALYHRPTWTPRARLVMRRLDHAAIFLLIAGTYTPVCLLLGGRAGTPLLTVVWGAAALGMPRATFWPRAPRWLAAGLYVLVGWAVLPVLTALDEALGWRGVALLGAGGLLYTVGAVIYAARNRSGLSSVHSIFLGMPAAIISGGSVAVRHSSARSAARSPRRSSPASRGS